MWGIVLLSCFVTGAVVTVILLWWGATRRTRRLGRLVLSGAVLWGGQVRWRAGPRRWGSTGLIVLLPDGNLEWLPDASSRKRGAAPTVWRLVDAHVKAVRTTQDTSGITYTEYGLAVDNREVGTFALFSRSRPETGRPNLTSSG
jgi:hypothetical protein